MLRGGDSTDTEIARFADAHDYVVVTKDADFRNLHTQGGWPKRLLGITAPNLRNRQLISLFQKHASEITSALAAAPFVELDEEKIFLHRISAV
jgi:predicted nuclease of predicted toxin-antitoxin system